MNHRRDPKQRLSMDAERLESELATHGRGHHARTTEAVAREWLLALKPDGVTWGGKTYRVVVEPVQLDVVDVHLEPMGTAGAPAHEIVAELLADLHRHAEAARELMFKATSETDRVRLTAKAHTYDHAKELVAMAGLRLAAGK